MLSCAKFRSGKPSRMVVIDRSMHAFFAQLASPVDLPKCHCDFLFHFPLLAGIISVDFDLDVALRTQIPVFHSKLRIFGVSADNVSK